MRLAEMRPWALAVTIPLALVASAVPVLTLLQAVTYEQPPMEQTVAWAADLERVDARVASRIHRGRRQPAVGRDARRRRRVSPDRRSHADAARPRSEGARS